MTAVHKSARSVLALLLFAAAACDDEPSRTQVLVVVRADSYSLARATSLVVSSVEGTRNLSGDRLVFPVRTVFEPTDGSRPFEIQVTGSGQGEQWQFDAEVSLVQGQRVMVEVVLSEFCASRTCGQGSTCSACGCQAIAQSPSALSDLSSVPGPGDLAEDCQAGDGGTDAMPEGSVPDATDPPAPIDGGDGQVPVIPPEAGVDGGMGPGSDGEVDPDGDSDPDPDPVVDVTLQLPPALAQGVCTPLAMTADQPAADDVTGTVVATGLTLHPDDACTGDAMQSVTLLQGDDRVDLFAQASLDSGRSGEASLAMEGELRAAPSAISVRMAAVHVTAGMHFTCASLTDDSVHCCGILDTFVPGSTGFQGAYRIQETPLRQGSVAAAVDQLVAGNNFACLRTAGRAECWGRDDMGQLGDGQASDGSRNARGAPVGLDANVTHVAAGYLHACAVAAGDVYCWGNNDSGQLGPDVMGTSSPTPQRVELGAAALQVSAGLYHSCALLDGDGGVRCWGGNTFGELGRGDTLDATGQIATVQAPAGVQSLSGNGPFTCLIAQPDAMDDPELHCWGFSEYAPTISGSFTNFSAPLDLEADGVVTSLDVGMWHACVAQDGDALCWGANSSGQLGVGSQGNLSFDDSTPSLRGGVTQVAAGVNAAQQPWGSSCAIRYGVVYCWGTNEWGEAGSTADLTHFPRAQLYTPFVGQQVRSVVVSQGYLHGHACAVLGPDDSLHCWGTNESGQLGVGMAVSDVSDEPVAVSGPLSSGVTAVGVGSRSTYAISDGRAYSWGSNFRGILGRGEFASGIGEVVIPGTAEQICSGSGHACVLADNGGDQSLYCWGANGRGQVGNDSTVDASTPQAVLSNRAITLLACGPEYTCVIVDGDLQCWGSSDGSVDTPTPIPGFTEEDFPSVPVQLGAGIFHGCLRLQGEAGTVRCWQEPGGWQYPAGVPSDGITDLAVGPETTCGVLEGQDVTCWGDNVGGQRGVGQLLNSGAPLLPVLDLPEGDVTVVDTGTRDAPVSCAVVDAQLYCWGDNSNRVVKPAPFRLEQPVVIEAWQ